MEDMDFGRISIDKTTTTSSNKSTAKSINAAHQTSIDDTPLEAGKFSLTYNVNEGVVLGEPKGQLSNTINQIINEHGSEIHVKINSISKRDHETNLPLQDYLNPGRTYCNRSAIKAQKDDTKKSRVSLEYLVLVSQNPFRGTVSEHSHDHIEYLEDMMDDEYNRCRPYEMMDVERGMRVDSMDGPLLAKIKESLDSLHSALEGQNQFGIYQIDDDTLSELEQQVDFVDIPTLKDRYPIPNADSFTQNYDATVGSRRGRAKFRLNQAFTGNCKMATDLNGKIDIIYSELMRKFDALINVVLLRSGKRLNPSTIEINYAEKRAEVEKTGESRSRPITLDSLNPESETPREKERSNAEEATIDLEGEEEELEENVDIDRQEGTNVYRPTTVKINRQTGNNVDRHSTPAKPAVERVYRTLPPFPPKKTQTKQELDMAICKKAFDKITLEMPLSDAIKVSSSIK
ncbi:hypothetical protein DY000_02046837 [Brassica cretica]|uniref:Uncharacterized protein n=1 Tax=Brassica cretica TaxID=69181 RepID=A0ABQ7ESN9_BRACR|nr:hypothetical protein DY000_02046837 [Brassica cretica]